MKAVVAQTLESLESYGLADVARPEPGPHEILIRVEACGVGYVDALVALGRYQVKPPVPHTPGQEVAGRVEAVGEKVKGFAAGDRVVAMGQRGFAEYAVAPAFLSVPLPDGTDFEAAAGFPLNYLTAWHGLKDRAALKAGETVLVFGAAGGVGSAAIQVAKALGAKVIAAASTPEKRDFALAQGADAVIDVQPEGWRDRLKALGKPDVVFDPVCGPLFEAAFRSLSWRGRHMVVGFVGGPIPALPANLTLMKGAALMGVDVRQYIQFDGAGVPAALAEMAALLESGALKPPVGNSYAFADFGAALTDAISGKGRGKVVLRVGLQG